MTHPMVHHQILQGGKHVERFCAVLPSCISRLAEHTVCTLNLLLEFIFFGGEIFPQPSGFMISTSMYFHINVMHITATTNHLE